MYVSARGVRQTTGIGTSRLAADAVILAGTVGHEPDGSGGLPYALLPLPHTTLIEMLLAQIAGTITGRLTVCANIHTSLLNQHVTRCGIDADRIAVVRDGVPRGTAGCLKTCQDRLGQNPFLVIGGSVWLDDDPAWMVEQHQAQNNALTVFCTPNAQRPDAAEQRLWQPAGVYCCDPVVLSYIAEHGYQDLKEQLIPPLKRAGLRVGAVLLPGSTCQVSDWRTYMSVLSTLISADGPRQDGYHELAPGVWCGRDVKIAPTARIVGPALLGHGCEIGDGAVVMGPTVLGDQCRIGRGAWLLRVVVPDRTIVQSGVSLAEQLVSTAPSTHSAPLPSRRRARETQGIPEQAVGAPRTLPLSLTATARPMVAGMLMLAAFVWALWYGLVGLWRS